MLFNSYLFLFAFFPAALAAYFVAGQFGERARLAAILGASFAFYAAWDVRFLALLGGSIAANFVCGKLITRALRDRRVTRASALLGLGIGFDLLTLAIFKYAHFFVANYNALSGDNIVIGKIILPLGISFFTFEQIGYLVDLRRGSPYRADILQFAVFVSFFPRLVAGPILRFGEIGPQLRNSAKRVPLADLAVGLSIFFIGLAKKTILADSIGAYVAPPFALATSGKPIDFFVAWATALAYTCQLYFDFSGYTDMAIGAARCFGIHFPMNFDSPYKSVNIIEFWRRWHMTLSRFLRDYLYFSLGGSRRGRIRRYTNLMITMVLGGLWHGASWTFVAWGSLHGLYLVINHAWHGMRGKFDLRGQPSGVGRLFGLAMTFLAVVVAWVFFRAPTFAAALSILQGMVGLHGASLPKSFAGAVAPLQPLLRFVGIAFVNGDGARTVFEWCWIFLLLAIAFAAPNTQEIMARFEPVLDPPRTNLERAPILWRPSLGWGIAIGTVAFVAMISIVRVSEFLYWQF